MKKIVIYLLLFSMVISYAQSIEKFSIDSGGASVNAGNIQILYTFGEVNVAERSTATITVSEGFITPVQINLNVLLLPVVYLQGPSLNPNTGEENLMRDALRASMIIPTTSPYTDGLTCDPAVFNATGTNAIVDWVWVELRDANDNTVLVAGTSALLQRDGDIVATDGSSSLAFDVPYGDYFVALAHRNHLGIISANTYGLSSSATAINLSMDNMLVTGNTNAVILLANGKYAMIAGDVDENGQVQNTDVATLRPLLGTAGYNNADLDMNGQIQLTDINNALRPNIGKGEQR